MWRVNAGSVTRKDGYVRLRVNNGELCSDVLLSDAILKRPVDAAPVVRDHTNP